MAERVQFGPKRQEETITDETSEKGSTPTAATAPVTATSTDQERGGDHEEQQIDDDISF